MRDHQKYFAVEKRNGELAPHFLAVINVDKDSKGLIRAGHERVLRARFADAQFFWQADQKCRLADYLPKLERVTYESRLGSYRDKVERIRANARWFTEQWFNLGMLQAHVAEADRAAELAKCDLATEMVREFTELQGIVGGLYARAQGESDEIADAVYDHYRPVGLEDPIPRNLTGGAVAARGQTRFRRWLFCSRSGTHRLERSLCIAPRRSGHRQNHSGEETPRFALPGHRRRGKSTPHSQAQARRNAGPGNSNPRLHPRPRQVCLSRTGRLRLR